jgi:hypothetical protein
MVGLTVSIFWSWYPEIFNRPEGPTVFLAIAVPCVTTFATAFILSCLIEKGGPHPGREFTWYSVVKR